MSNFQYRIMLSVWTDFTLAGDVLKQPESALVYQKAEFSYLYFAAHRSDVGFGPIRGAEGL